MMTSAFQRQLSIIGSICLILYLWVTPCFSATYYIDYAGGSDANNGTAKETPWKLAPGMQGCLITDTNNNNCRARTHATTAGDTFVFKGGVTWPKEALSFDWYFGNTTTFTVDATWYTGGSWTRPIFDNEGVETTASPEGTTSMMRAYGSNNVVDNIEFKRAAQLHGGTNGYGASMLGIAPGGAVGGEVKNCYFHGWSHGGTATGDNTVILSSASVSEGPDMNLKIHDNVWDGSDSSPTPGDMAAAYKGSAGHFYNNYIGYVQNGSCCYMLGYVWGNTFSHVGYVTNFDPTMHMQCYEAEGGAGNTYVYNNYIINPSGGSTIILYPESNYKLYVFNNVVTGDTNQTIQVGSTHLSAGNSAGAYIWNNTFQGPTANTVNRISGPIGTEISFMTITNNYLIGYAEDLINPQDTTTPTETTNIDLTNAQATTAGYVVTGTYPYFPPAGGASVDAGTSLASFCATLTDTSPSTPTTDCAKDTTLGVNYNATSHTVTYPLKTAVTRTTWDIGAYEYGGTSPGTGTGITVSGCTIQ